MRRSSKLFPAILALASLSLVLPEATPAADPDEVADLLGADRSPGVDAAKVQALLDILREAERRSARKRSNGEGGSAPPPAESGAAEAAVAAAAPEVVADDAGEADEESGGEDATPKSVARPGCMYSGRKLIWEKLPGTCSR